MCTRNERERMGQRKREGESERGGECGNDNVFYGINISSGQSFIRAQPQPLKCLLVHTKHITHIQSSTQNTNEYSWPCDISLAIRPKDFLKRRIRCIVVILMLVLVLLILLLLLFRCTHYTTMFLMIFVVVVVLLIRCICCCCCCCWCCYARMFAIIVSFQRCEKPWIYCILRENIVPIWLRREYNNNTLERLNRKSFLATNLLVELKQTLFKQLMLIDQNESPVFAICSWCLKTTIRSKLN